MTLTETVTSFETPVPTGGVKVEDSKLVRDCHLNGFVVLGEPVTQAQASAACAAQGLALADLSGLIQKGSSGVRALNGCTDTAGSPLWVDLAPRGSCLALDIDAVGAVEVDCEAAVLHPLCVKG